MKITVHGHRPACFASPTSDQPAESGAAAPQENVKTVDLGCFKLKIHQRSARLAALAQIPPGQMNKAEYIAAWDAWAKSGGAERKGRQEAVRRMKECLTINAGLVDLNLSSLGLTSLPISLPRFLRYLDICFNRLTSLPDNLPASLQRLNVRSNRLTSLPDKLPAALRWLDASSNELTSLPVNLPEMLYHLNVGGNPLTSLPANITSRLGSNCVIALQAIAFSQQALTRLNQVANAQGYTGPRFLFSMAAAPNRPSPQAMAAESSSAPTRRIADAFLHWYKIGEKEMLRSTWTAIADEPGAVEFSRFLNRLHDTVNYAYPQFRASVV